MKRNLFAVGCLVVATMLVSCNPRVTANLMEVLPERQVDSVMVYKIDETMPTEARKIGTVKVTDGGMTHPYDCLYGNMLALAVKKTAASGANALHIDKHKKPNIWTSSCHRIWGTMYLLPDSMVTTGVLSDIQMIEMDHDIELAAAAREQRLRQNRLAANPKNVMRFDVGYGLVTSEFMIGDVTYKNKGGFTVNAAYQHYWHLFGLGAEVINYRTTFDDIFHMNMFYIGPNIGLSMKLGEKWRYDASFGVGLGVYKESISGYSSYSYSENRCAVKSDLGIEYMLSKSIGLGFRMNAFNLPLKEPEDYQKKDNESYGITRIDFLIGLRTYF